MKTARLIASLALLSTLVVGTPPLPPPYHQFTVEGTLTRPAGGPKADFAVVLFGRSPELADSAYRVLNGIPSPRVRDIPVALTDTSGTFRLRVSSDVPLDSLRLAVIVPDRVVTAGQPFATSAVPRIPHDETFAAGPSGGCSACLSEPETATRTVYFAYAFPGRSIVYPF